MARPRWKMMERKVKVVNYTCLLYINSKSFYNKLRFTDHNLASMRPRQHLCTAFNKVVPIVVSRLLSLKK